MWLKPNRNQVKTKEFRLRTPVVKATRSKSACYFSGARWIDFIQDAGKKLTHQQAVSVLMGREAPTNLKQWSYFLSEKVSSNPSKS